MQNRAQDFSISDLFLNAGFYYSAVIFCLVAAYFFQTLLPLGHDMAWLLDMAGKMLAGQELYQDVIEVNPPLIIFISSIPVWLSKWLGGSSILWFRIFFLFLAVLIWLPVPYLLQRIFDGKRPVFTAFNAAVLFAVISLFGFRMFGQREHFIALFSVLYLLVIACRILDRSVPSWLALLSGVLAGLAVSLKPYHGATFVLIEVYLFFRSWRWLGFLRTEVMAMLATGLLYVACVWFFVPHYFGFVVPLVVDLYWPYQSDLYLVMNTALSIPLFLLLWLVYRSFTKNTAECALASVLVLGVLGSYIAYLLPMQAWQYHLLPCQIYYLWLMMMAIGLFVRRRLLKRPAKQQHFGKGFAAGAGLFLLVFAMVFYGKIGAFSFNPLLSRHSEVYASRHKNDVGLQNILVNYVKPGEGVYSFTSHLYPVFPTLQYIQAAFQPRYAILWMLPAIIRDSGKPLNETQKNHLLEVEQYVFKTVLEDLAAQNTRVVLVDVSAKKMFFGNDNIDYIEYFSQDPAFVELWQEFELVDQYSMDKPKIDLAIYLRRKAGE